MKKIIIILFLFLLFYSCYTIYQKTENNKLYITSIGDIISFDEFLYENPKVSTYNTDFINKDNRIIDISNTLKYNIEIPKDTKDISIHQILKKTDILIISIGMNDIYSKINENTKEIYSYLNNILTTYESILKKINNYNYKKVIVLGYYNINNKNNDIFTYINYKLNKLTTKYNYQYLNLNPIFYNNPKLLINSTNFYPNKKGIQEINKLIVENLKKY